MTTPVSRKAFWLTALGLVAIALIATRLGGRAAVRFGPAEAVSGATDVGMAPMFAVSPTGVEAVAWVSAPGGGTDGRLYVSVAGAAPVELRDTLGPVEAHGEAPPKLTFGPDGALNAIYVVPKVVPGKRFPLAALRFIRSPDGGKTWSPPVNVADDAVFGAHNFHALHAASDGSLYVSWLDSRNGKSAVYITRSTDAGRTWERNRPVGSGEACPCCRTALATASDGTLYVAWRLVLPGNIRDIVVARSRDHGVSWTDPARVHADDWHVAGCPHAGPALQVDDGGRLHVAWWTGKTGQAGVFYAQSADSGRTFSAPRALGVAKFSRPAHVQLVSTRGGRVVVAWDDGTREVPEVVVRLSRDGGRSFERAQRLSPPGQWATFPALAVSDTSVTVAWSQETPAAAAAEEHAMPDMKDPKAVMGLHAVGEAHVMVRRGRVL